MAPRTSAPLLALLALLLLLPPAAQARSPLQVGMASDGLLLNSSEADGARAVADWGRLGIDVVRLQVQWSRVAPVSDAPAPPPNFDPANPDAGYAWADIDRAVRLIVAGGLKPMLMLSGPPPLWASLEPEEGNPRSRPSAWHFGQFATAVARRYGHVVEDYILWNEPNLPLWVQPQAACKGTRCQPLSPHLYRFMVRAAYPAIHAADADARVLIGALAPAGHRLRSRNANMKPLRFLRAFGCVGRRFRPKKGEPCRTFAPAPADGFAYHPHSTKLPPTQDYDHPDDASIAGLGRLGRTLDRLQEDGRLLGATTPLGLWLDEYAYQTNPPDKLRGVTPGRQDRYLQEAAYVAWRNPRVRLLTQYLWRDEVMGGGTRYTGWQSGLLDFDGRPKLALYNFDDPIWVDVRRDVIWGQIRPGGAHDVVVQVRKAGAGTPWETLGSTRTAADGTWFVSTPVEPFASYRAVYDAGRTTTTLVATPPGYDGPLVDRNERDRAGRLVERRIAARKAGAPVPRSFAGFSMEWTSVPDYLGSGGRINPIFARLVREVSGTAGGRPTLRFGGESTEHTWWNPAGLPKPPGVATDVDEAWMDHLATWVERMRTPLVLGLNMGLDDPAKTSALAAAIRAALPPRFVRNLELGNEPDLYPTPRTYVVGKNRRRREVKRPPGYGFDEYRSEIDEHVGAVHPAAPDLALAAGGFASGSWDDLQSDILTAQPSVKWWSAHAYPLQTCDVAVRRRGGARLIPALLGPTAYASIVDRMRHLVAVATSHGASVQLSETNSSICGGLHGLSDTLASALWATDLMFGLADAGVRGVNFHMWTGSQYGAVDMRTERGRPVAKVRPLFYALWLYNRATPPGSRFVAVGPNAPGARVKTWGTVDGKGTRRIVAINKDRGASRKLVLTLPARMARVARVERLRGPRVESENLVTFGGRGWGASTATGAPKGKRRIGRVRVKRRTVRLVLPAGSAALITVPRR